MISVLTGRQGHTGRSWWFGHQPGWPATTGRKEDPEETLLQHLTEHLGSNTVQAQDAWRVAFTTPGLGSPRTHPVKWKKEGRTLLGDWWVPFPPRLLALSIPSCMDYLFPLSRKGDVSGWGWVSLQLRALSAGVTLGHAQVSIAVSSRNSELAGEPEPFPGPFLAPLELPLWHKIDSMQNYLA